jgi:hypothetical protein
MTAGSIQRVLNTMQQLHEHAAPGVLPERKSGDGWELTATSSFVDIGSGYGKVRVAAIPSWCLAAVPPPLPPSDTAASREASSSEHLGSSQMLLVSCLSKAFSRCE